MSPLLDLGPHTREGQKCCKSPSLTRALFNLFILKATQYLVFNTFSRSLCVRNTNKQNEKCSFALVEESFSKILLVQNSWVPCQFRQVKLQRKLGRFRRKMVFLLPEPTYSGEVWFVLFCYVPFGEVTLRRAQVHFYYFSLEQKMDFRFLALKMKNY